MASQNTGMLQIARYAVDGEWEKLARQLDVEAGTFEKLGDQWNAAQFHYLAGQALRTHPTRQTATAMQTMDVSSTPPRHAGTRRTADRAGRKATEAV